MSVLATSESSPNPTVESANQWSATQGGPILVGIDWPRGAQRALSWAANIALGADTKVILVHAISPWAGIELAVPPFDYDAYRDGARKAVASWTKRLGALDRDIRMVEESPAAAILEVADEFDPALIVVGAHARGSWSPPLLGSVTSKILQGARNPVAVVPEPTTADNSGAIVVGIDGSPASERALRWAALSTFTSGRDIHVVSIFPRDLYAARPHFETVGPGDDHGQTVRSLRQLTDRVAAETGRRITSDIEFGSPVECLASISRDAFAIVLGKSGHGDLSQMILGSTGRAVATHSPVPVVFVP